MKHKSAHHAKAAHHMEKASHHHEKPNTTWKKLLMKRKNMKRNQLKNTLKRNNI